MMVRLIGKTQKGNNRVRERGDVWEVLKIEDDVLFSDQHGPWLFLHPVSDPDKGSNHNRWVHQHDDKDFIIKDIEETA